MGTEFERVYKCFYSKITDDMYMELDEAQTAAMTQELLLNALPWFEFPRVNINDYDLELEAFNVNLTYEEANIIATYMMLGWFDQQLASVENARMKYSGSDFKFTSQANHMAKLTALRKEYERIGLHLQRLYKRRKADKNGVIRSTMGSIMSTSVRNGNVGSGSFESGSAGGKIPELNDSGNGSWDDMGGSDSSGGSSDSWDEMS